MAFLPKQGEVLEISEDHEAVDEHHFRIGFSMVDLTELI